MKWNFINFLIFKNEIGAIWGFEKHQYLLQLTLENEITI